MVIPQQILETLQKYGQAHVVSHWEQLNDLQKNHLIEQIESIDFELLQKLSRLRQEQKTSGETSAERALRAKPPKKFFRLPKSQAERDKQFTAVDAGEDMLRAGKVAAVLVAGGQGTRLGFDAPKGIFPIGPVSDRSLFQIYCEQVLARSRRSGVVIPYFIMTSEATHKQTVAFFEKNRYFGIKEDDVFFFQQASLPALEDGSDRMLMERIDRIATSPDGHGGMLRALHNFGMLDIIRDREIEHLYYHQVDNPTAIVCDPEVMGYHLMTDSDMTTKVVSKVSADEKTGVLVSVDDKTEIIEYSDMPSEVANRVEPDGSLTFWAGNTAIHVIKVSFIERLLNGDLNLPFHVAHKKVTTIDESGASVIPATANAHKFEQFIFDALPQAGVALVVEADRATEFNPVKNAEGNDSPATSRAALLSISKNWIESAGGHIENNAQVEISPLYALDKEELQVRLDPGQTFRNDTILKD